MKNFKTYYHHILRPINMKLYQVFFFYYDVVVVTVYTKRIGNLFQLTKFLLFSFLSSTKGENEKHFPQKKD